MKKKYQRKCKYKKKKQKGQGYLGGDKWSRWFTEKQNKQQFGRGAWSDLKFLAKTLTPIKSNFGY